MSVIDTTHYRIIREETSYNTEELSTTLPARINSLNVQQRAVYEDVVQSIEAEDGKLFALQASGGTGKTYTLNVVLDTIRSRGQIALATAMSGIASTLLHNGRTLHSTCAVPINVNENSTCGFGKRENDAIGNLKIKAKNIVHLS